MTFLRGIVYQDMDVPPVGPGQIKIGRDKQDADGRIHHEYAQLLR